MRDSEPIDLTPQDQLVLSGSLWLILPLGLVMFVSFGPVAKLLATVIWIAALVGGFIVGRRVSLAVRSQVDQITLRGEMERRDLWASTMRQGFSPWRVHSSMVAVGWNERTRYMVTVAAVVLDILIVCLLVAL